MTFWHVEVDALLLEVLVVPGGSRDRVVGFHGDAVKVQVAAPPEGGRANRATVAVVARWAALSPGAVSLVRGTRSRRKQLRLQCAPARAARRRARGPARLELTRPVLDVAAGGQRSDSAGGVGLGLLGMLGPPCWRLGPTPEPKTRERARSATRPIARAVDRWLLIGGAATVVIVADQTHEVVGPHELDSPMHVIGSLRFNLAFNSGTAFSRFQGWGQVIAVLAVVVVVILLRASRTVRPPWGALAMGLVLGGAVGNLVDRVTQSRATGCWAGRLTDFIDLQWWPVFNIADAGITVGGLALVLFGLVGDTADERTRRAVPGGHVTEPER